MSSGVATGRKAPRPELGSLAPGGGVGNDAGADDPFAQPNDTIIISIVADPAADSEQHAGADDRRLDDKIKSLERDQKALQQQADALKRRAKKLRQEANL